MYWWLASPFQCIPLLLSLFLTCSQPTNHPLPWWRDLPAAIPFHPPPTSFPIFSVTLPTPLRLYISKLALCRPHQPFPFHQSQQRGLQCVSTMLVCASWWQGSCSPKKWMVLALQKGEEGKWAISEMKAGSLHLEFQEAAIWKMKGYIYMYAFLLLPPAKCRLPIPWRTTSFLVFLNSFAGVGRGYCLLFGGFGFAIFNNNSWYNFFFFIF